MKWNIISKIMRKIAFEYNAFSEKDALFRIAFYLCEEVFWEKFDYNASLYFRVKTVGIFKLDICSGCFSFISSEIFL